MIKYISWNNKRRNIAYWISIILLMFVSTNITVWFDISNIMLIRSLRNTIYSFLEKVMPKMVNHYITNMLLTLITLALFMTLLIVVINHIIGLLPDIKIPYAMGAYSFLFKSAVLADILLGAIIIVLSFIGLLKMNGYFGEASIALYLYTIIFVLSSYLYWKNIIPIKKMNNIIKKIKQNDEYEYETWYCISNSDYRFSTFSRVPWKGRVTEVIFDEVDKKICANIKPENFFYYLILIDGNKIINEVLLNNIYRIMKFPHAKVLVLFFEGDESVYHPNDVLNFIVYRQNVHIEVIKNKKLNRELNLEEIIFELNLRKKLSKRHPLRYIQNKELINIYMELGKGSKINLEFMKIIICELDIMPAIYALFDYIDLQYRIAIAYYIEPDKSWLKQKSRIIGNIGTMAKILDNPLFQKRSQNKEIITSDLWSNIISDEELEIIYKYFPKYKIDLTRPVEHSIIYLTSSLRNILRGHGTFDKVDAMLLYELVFKLALMNDYILSANDVVIEKTTRSIECRESTYYYVLGRRNDETPKNLSPFILASEIDNILVFNNWYKKSNVFDDNSVEYINYLNGTLIRPEFRNISLEVKT